MTYVYDQGWEKEKARLGALGLLFDSGTTRHIHDLGIAEGWSVLEVGAGSGTLAGWFRHRVDDAGRVVFTDLDVRHLGPAADMGVEVLQHDILVGPPEVEAFDLVHARAVVEWIADRKQALASMVGALRPGGWLLIEDVDFITAGCAHPGSTLRQRVADAMAQLASMCGADLNLGRRLVPLLDEAGLENVHAEGRAPVQRNGDATCACQVLTLEQIGSTLVEAGLLSEQEVEEVQLEVSTSDNGVGFPPMMVAAWGRKPVVSFG